MFKKVMNESVTLDNNNFNTKIIKNIIQNFSKNFKESFNYFEKYCYETE